MSKKIVMGMVAALVSTLALACASAPEQGEEETAVSQEALTGSGYCEVDVKTRTQTGNCLGPANMCAATPSSDCAAGAPVARWSSRCDAYVSTKGCSFSY